MNGYELSRNFVDFSFENPSKIKPNHYALYFFSIEHCNRLGWKKEFGLPTTMTMEAIGIKSYASYIKTFNELVDLGFYILVERSKNQYSANIIELSKNDKAPDKALDKAFVKHASKQQQSTHESIDSIDKPINNKPINKQTINKEVENFLQRALKSDSWLENVCRATKRDLPTVKNKLSEYDSLLLATLDKKNNFKDYGSHFTHWLNKQEVKPTEAPKRANYHFQG